VRRWCAPLLDLEPSAPAGRYLQRRAELGPQEVTRRLLRAAQVEAWLVETGYRGGELLTPAQVTQASGAPAHEVARLEAVAEQVAEAGVAAAGYPAAVQEAVAATAGAAVAFKSIAATPPGRQPPRSLRQQHAGCARSTQARRPGSPTRCCSGTRSGLE
jgi:hypothetical protein